MITIQRIARHMGRRQLHRRLVCRPLTSRFSTAGGGSRSGSGISKGSDSTTHDVSEAEIIEDNEVQAEPNPMQDRTVKELYRDCMRLTYHLGGISKKGDAMRQMVRLVLFVFLTWNGSFHTSFRSRTPFISFRLYVPFCLTFD